MRINKNEALDNGRGGNSSSTYPASNVPKGASAIRERLYETPRRAVNELRTYVSPVGVETGMGDASGVSLLLHFVKTPVYTVDVRHKVYEHILNIISDYDENQATDKYFVDSYPSILASYSESVPGLAASQQLDNEAVAAYLTHVYFTYVYDVMDLLAAGVVWANALRLKGLPHTTRWRKSLKFTSWKTDSDFLDGLALPPGLMDFIVDSGKILLAKGEHSELGISLPIFPRTGTARIEFFDDENGGAVGNFGRRSQHTGDLGLIRLPMLNEYFAHGAYDVGDAADPRGLAIFNELRDQVSGYGNLPNYIKHNWNTMLDIFAKQWMHVFNKPNNVFRKVYGNLFGLIPTSELFSFTAFTDRVRNTPFGDAHDYAAKYIDGHTLPDVIPAAIHGYSASDVISSVPNLARMPIIAANGTPLSFDKSGFSGIDLMTPQERANWIYSASDLANRAQRAGAVYPFVGFAIDISKLHQLNAFVSNPTIYRGDSNFANFLESITEADAAWINYSNEHGVYHNSVLAASIARGDDSPFFFDVATEGLATWLPGDDLITVGDDLRHYPSHSPVAVRANFRALLSQIASYSQNEGDLIKGITKLNSLHGDMYLDPTLVAKGIFIPQRSSTPIVTSWDVAQCGFAYVLTKEGYYNDGLTGWGKALRSLELNSGRNVTGMAAADEIVNMVDSLGDAPIFLGLSALFRPQELFENVPLWRASEFNLPGKTAAADFDVETLGRAASSNIVMIPSLLSMKALTDRDVPGYAYAAVSRDAEVMPGGYSFNQPLINSDSLISVLEQGTVGFVGWLGNALFSTLGLKPLDFAVDKLSTDKVRNATLAYGKIMLNQTYPSLLRKVPEVLMSPVQYLTGVFTSKYTGYGVYQPLLDVKELEISSASLDLEELKPYLDVEGMIKAAERAAKFSSAPSNRGGSSRGRSSSGRGQSKRSNYSSKPSQHTGDKPYFGSKPGDTETSYEKDYSKNKFSIDEGAVDTSIVKDDKRDTRKKYGKFKK